jgi:alkanesulfonate monooxygenase SsuD/methylene tetrahydromethanopterin reductase-like flavin-dependent oxidoreductase (luciferase family)
VTHEMAETVDLIGGCRLILGIGVDQDEHEAYGFTWVHRFDRLEETLAIIRGLVRDGHVGRTSAAAGRELTSTPRGRR